jgi:hypothetical protein
MNLFHSIIVVFALLYASCSYTSVSCPIEYNGSKIVIYKKPTAYEKPQIMYQHSIQYCGIKEEIYSVQNETIHELLAAEPEKNAYSTIWGIYKELGPIYVIHIMIGLFYMCAIMVIDQETKDRRYK